MMVPIQVIRWYRMQCYDGTDSCAIVVPIRRYCQLEFGGVEYEKRMWKHSPKSKAPCQVRLLLFPNYVPSHNFFRNFFAKSFVVSIIFVTFAVEFERTEKNGRDDDSN